MSDIMDRVIELLREYDRLDTELFAYACDKVPDDLNRRRYDLAGRVFVLLTEIKK